MEDMVWPLGIIVNTIMTQVFIYQQENCFKKILKFTFKQFLQVSWQPPSSGSALFELAKVISVKIID